MKKKKDEDKKEKKGRKKTSLNLHKLKSTLKDQSILKTRTRRYTICQELEEHQY